MMQIVVTARASTSRLSACSRALSCPRCSYRQYGQRSLHASTFALAQVAEDVIEKADGKTPPAKVGLTGTIKDGSTAPKSDVKVGQPGGKFIKKKGPPPIASVRKAGADSKGTKQHNIAKAAGKKNKMRARAHANTVYSRAKNRPRNEDDSSPSEPPSSKLLDLLHENDLNSPVSTQSKKANVQSSGLFDMLFAYVASRFGLRRAKTAEDEEKTAEQSDEASKLVEEQLKLAAAATTKAQRMVAQSKLIRQAIKNARERSAMADVEEESFFYPYPEGNAAKTHQSNEGVWLDLGPEPDLWGRSIPLVNDRWHEVLALGLTKEIVVSQRPFAQRIGNIEGMSAEEQEAAFGELVDDYDLEDHERLEQLGDSIVNMSSRLLAYQTYPDVNEGTLTRLSNYPAQNNFLALLYQECGLAARREELRLELRRAAGVADLKASQDSSQYGTMAHQGAYARPHAKTEDDMGKLPFTVKRDADMFEAYAAAVFLTNGSNFQIVHEWLSHLFRPFHDQAYRFMSQRSEYMAKARAAKHHHSGEATDDTTVPPAPALSIPGYIDTDPEALTAAALSRLYPNLTNIDYKSASRHERQSSLNGMEPFASNDILTVAARARRSREERVRERVRLQHQQELMDMGLFQKGFLNLRKGFRQYLLGKDVKLEEETLLRQRTEEERARAGKVQRNMIAQGRAHRE